MTGPYQRKVRVTLTQKEAAELYVAAAIVADDVEEGRWGTPVRRQAWKRAIDKLQIARQKAVAK